MFQLFVIGLHDESDYESNGSKQETQGEAAAPAATFVAEDHAPSDTKQKPDN